MSGKLVKKGHVTNINQYSQTTTRKNADGTKEKIRFVSDQKRGSKVDLGSVEFSKEFDVYSDDSHEAFYLLDPLVMEKMIKLKEELGPFNLAIHDGVMDLGFFKRYLFFKLPTSMKKVEAIDENMVREKFSHIMWVANDLSKAMSAHKEGEDYFSKEETE